MKGEDRKEVYRRWDGMGGNKIRVCGEDGRDGITGMVRGGGQGRSNRKKK